MKRFLLLLAAFFTALPAQGEPFGRGADDLAAETRAAAEEGKLLAVLFEQQDCVYCHALRNEVLTHGEAAVFEQRFRTVKVAIDVADALKTPKGDSLPSAAQWAEKLGVSGTPAFVFFDGEGGLVYRHTGTLSSPRELILLGRFIHEQAYEEAPWAAYRDAHETGNDNIR
ncbi:MAG: thioredoxin fold domain-containing protein [Azoarcus sp.]|jgi:thioredoxin-related protein|nr:thioredoxin fold domain-containing protein [Azoarcus sp.]